jgi:alkylation response protein AidB-like acyl-CoA dehydrogenase
MNFDDTPQEAAFRAEARAWIQANAPKHLESELSEPSVGRIKLRSGDILTESKRWQKKKAEAGWACLHWPKEYGGRGASPIERVIWQQEEGVFIKLESVFLIGQGMCGPTMMAYAGEEDKKKYLPKLASGETIWCQLFSEPSAGSDAAAVKTRATRVDGGWKITGQKVWTSGAHYCKRGLATVRTDFDVPKHAGITTVILDMNAPGVEVRPLRQITGGADFNEVFFTDVFVPDEDVVGEPNSGWTVARATLGNERVSIGGGAGTIAPAAAWLVSLATRHGERHVGAVQWVGKFLARDQALRLLNLRRVVRALEGAGPGPEGNITKLILAEQFQEQGTIAAALVGPDVALDGGEGEMAGRTALGSRALSIAGGTSEITRNQIAERILGMPRDPLIK